MIPGLFIDVFLQYPIACSFGLSTLVYILYPVHYEKSEATKGWRWALSCAALFTLVAIISVFSIPVLAIVPDSVVFRPTPSCSIFDNPVRYICLTLNEQHQHEFYITTWEKCHGSDANMKNASKYYIISSWIPSFDHFVTIEPVLFQPESSPDENKKAYYISEGDCVRAAGPSGGDRQKVAFYSINGSHYHLLDSGYINSSLLKKFHSGWYHVSNCNSELSRWWYDNCTLGYVSSHYVRLPQYARTLLLEDRDSI